MKKIFTTFVIATAVTLGVGCQAARIDSNGANSIAKISYDAELFPYEQVIPDDQIVKGSETAEKTIENLLGKDVEVVENTTDLFTFQSVAIKVEKTPYVYYKVDMESDKEDSMIIYLFDDDTTAVVATPNETEFISANRTEMDMSWDTPEMRNQLNSTDSVFSWNNQETSYAICKKGTCSSVWIVNSKSDEAHHIWCNSDCPIWT